MARSMRLSTGSDQTPDGSSELTGAAAIREPSGDGVTGIVDSNRREPTRLVMA
jgi:hypothetical protein